MDYNLIEIFYGGRDLDITRYFRHIEKENKSRENVGEPTMKIVFLYVDFSNEGHEMLKL